MTRADKPRVHWVSPLPPAQTDIAHYTQRILPELAAETDLTLWTDAPTWDRSLHEIARVRRLDPDRVTPRDFARSGRATPGPGPEAVFVNMGNAWPFHAGFLRMAQRLPSIVVLHDMALQEMYFDAMDRALFPREIYEAAMLRWHGEAAVHAMRDVFAGRHDRGVMGLEYPGFELALTRAVSVLTHTPVARDAVRAAFPDLPVTLAGLPFRPSPHPPELIRSRLEGLRLVQFGYTGPNRRLQNVLEALAPLRDEIAFRLDVFGPVWDPDYIRGYADELDLRHRVHLHGFVPEPELDAALARAHLAFNLRNPTMGEASGSQMRIWNAGVPAAVTDLGWYAALPEGTVFKIDPDAEITGLQDLVRRLEADLHLGRDIARAGRAQLEAAHAPKVYAKHVVRVAKAFAQNAAKAVQKSSLDALALDKFS